MSNSVFLLIVLIMCLWMLAGIKTAYDQMKLFKEYKAKIDPSFPMSPLDLGKVGCFGYLHSSRNGIISNQHH